MITHSWGGGTERHVKDLTQVLRGLVNVVILRIIDDGMELSAPTMSGLSALKLANNEHDQLIAILQAFDIRRAHIHQIVGHGGNLRSIISELSIPFDMTLHDYYVICPQMHLHTPTVARYCGELGVEQCNHCIAENNPFGAHDIGEWRTRHAWFVENAERVICPSKDVKDRITKYYPRANLMIAPHEPNLIDLWTVIARPVSISQRLRVIIIGYLVAHKGRETVEGCIRQGAHLPIEFMLIGTTQPPLPPDIRKGLFETGIYREAELVGRLKDLAPHVIWFPQPVPESYSYTLTAAIDTGLPIVASRIGALPERLEGRPLTWFVDDVAATPSKWLATFESIREQLATAPLSPQVGKRARSEPYYPGRYLSFRLGQGKPTDVQPV